MHELYWKVLSGILSFHISLYICLVWTVVSELSNRLFPLIRFANFCRKEVLSFVFLSLFYPDVCQSWSRKIPILMLFFFFFTSLPSGDYLDTNAKVYIFLCLNNLFGMKEPQCNTAMLLQMWTPHQQPGHHLGPAQKCRIPFLPPTNAESESSF